MPKSITYFLKKSHLKPSALQAKNLFLLILVILGTLVSVIFLLSCLNFLPSKSEIISPIPPIKESALKKLPSLSKNKVESPKKTLLSATNKPSPKATTFPAKTPEIIVSNNTPPISGYQRQEVQTDQGIFTVDLVAADLNTTQVIVDTASENDCQNDCLVLPLADYVARNSAFAGINGSYFCPADYLRCSHKKNSFDTLLMNKNKKYFNSENNIYSTVPAVIFSGNSARFVAQSLEWGRDTGVDAVIANQPLLVLDGQLLFRGDDDFKRGVKSNRSFIGTTGSTVYIGVVHNASVAESAQVVHTLGLNSALNLDSGWSTALWFEGYRVGPGRDIPNAILLVHK